jgi:hypothetical protein
MDLAKRSLAEIEKNGNCFDDKLDAYSLLIDINLCGHELEQRKQYISLCFKILKSLGEDVEMTPRFSSISYLSTILVTRFNAAFTSDSRLLSWPRMESKETLAVMKFYCQLVLLSQSYGQDTIGMAYHISLAVRYVLKKKAVCGYTASALAFFSASLTYGFDEKNCREALRIGKVALTFLDETKHKMQLPQAL